MTFSFSFSGIKDEVYNKISAEFVQIGARLKWDFHQIEAKLKAVAEALWHHAGTSASVSVVGSDSGASASLSVSVTSHSEAPAPAAPVVSSVAAVAEGWPARITPAPEAPAAATDAVEQAAAPVAAVQAAPVGDSPSSSQPQA